MTGQNIVLVAGFALGSLIVFPAVGSAQKIISVKTCDRYGGGVQSRGCAYGLRGNARRKANRAPKAHHAFKAHIKRHSHGMRTIAYGRQRQYGPRPKFHHHRKARFKNFKAFAFPEQQLFPPYYESKRPAPRQNLAASHIKAGLTVRQGSPWRGSIKGGLTVELGSPKRSIFKGGRTIERGSIWAGHIRGGRTVQQGSPWASTRRNWRFSGYEAPVRPKGLKYYRAKHPRTVLSRQRQIAKHPRVRGAKYRQFRY